MQEYRLHELMPYRIGGVQARHGILEDYGDLVAADSLHYRLARADELLPVKLYGAADYLAGGGEYLHYGVSGDGLAGAALADYAEDLAALQIKGDAVHGLDFARGGEEGGLKIAYFQKRYIG